MIRGVSDLFVVDEEGRAVGIPRKPKKLVKLILKGKCPVDKRWHASMARRKGGFVLLDTSLSRVINHGPLADG